MRSQTKGDKSIKVAVFHHNVGQRTAIGALLERLVLGLVARGFDITVYSGRGENLEPAGIHLIKIPVIKRPLVLLFISFHLISLVRYCWHRLRGKDYDIVIGVESNFLFPVVCYPHFCHKVYLRHEWSLVKTKGWLRLLRWLNHKLRALLEPWVYRKAQCIVVPSQGLKQEIEREFPFTVGKVKVIPNFVEWQKMQAPVEFNRSTFRVSLGYKEDDIIAVFVALGDFERKGLDHVFAILPKMSTKMKLLVVGGRVHELDRWRRRASVMGIEAQVKFVGLQKDIRPYLWIADVFVFPSAKETFSLVVFEAAAAGLPLVVTRLYGVEEFMRDGKMGYVVERNPEALASALNKFITLPREQRSKMGAAARDAVAAYISEAFVDAWFDLLQSLVTSKWMR